MSETEERRSDPRRECTWPVNIVVDDEIVSGETVDISANGVHVHCDDPLPMNEVMSITIAPPGKELIKVKARVIWSDLDGIDMDNRPVGMGLCFVEISESDQQYFTSVISDL